jgi:hypothetical protein
LGKGLDGIHDADCIYCASPIQYAIVQPQNSGLLHAFQPIPGAGSPQPHGLPNLFS